MKKKQKYLSIDTTSCSTKKWVVSMGNRTNRKRRFFDSRRGAEDFMLSDEFLIVVGRKAAPVIPAISPSQISVEEAVEWYCRNVSANKSEYSAKTEPKKLKEWKNRHSGKFLREVGLKELFEDRTNIIKTRNYLPQSANRWLTLIKTFFKSCHEAGFIDVNPAVGIKKLPVAEPRCVEVISELDQRRLLKATKPWVRNPLWLAMNTGMRRGEIVNLRWGAVNLKQGYLVVESSHGFKTKNKKSRMLPLTVEMSRLFSSLRDEASKVVKPDALVFITPTGRAIKPNRFTLEAKKVMKRVLGRNSGAIHIWRHTALTQMLQKGADIETVRRVAGHSSLTITQQYVHSTDTVMLQAMSKLEQNPVHFGENVSVSVSEEQNLEKADQK